MPLITDHFARGSNGVMPLPTTLSAQKVIGASSLSLSGSTGWPTTTPVHFRLYETTTTGTTTTLTPGTLTLWKGILSGTTVSNLTLEAGTDQLYPIGSVADVAPTSAWADDLVLGLEVQHNPDGTHNGVPVTALYNPYKCDVYLSSNQTVTASTWTKAQLNTKNYDTSNNFDNTTNYQFTASVAGFYVCEFALGFSGLSDGGLYAIGLNIGSFASAPTYQLDTGNAAVTPSGPSLSGVKRIQLAANQTVQGYGYTSGTTFVGGTGPIYSYFTATLESGT